MSEQCGNSVKLLKKNKHKLPLLQQQQHLLDDKHYNFLYVSYI